MEAFEEKVMDEFSEVKQRLTSLETTIQALPCVQHSNDITALKLTKATLVGICTGVSLVVSGSVAIITYLLKG